MSDKRKRRLFGKPIPNPAEEAEKLAEAAKDALNVSKNAGASAAAPASAALNSAAAKIAQSGPGTNLEESGLGRSLEESAKPAGDVVSGTSVAGAVGEATNAVGDVSGAVTGRLNDRLLDINGSKLAGAAGAAGAAVVAGTANAGTGVAGAADGVVSNVSAAASGSSGSRTSGSGSVSTAKSASPAIGGSTVNSVNTIKATEWVPSRGRRALPLALGALGLVGLTGLQAFAARGKVEDNLRKQSLGKLKDEFPDLKVRTEGRDVFLDGTVADGESRKRAHDLVRQIKGVRHVEDPKVVSPAPAEVAADAQVPLTIDTVAPVDSAADGMASIAEVTGDTVPETTLATAAVTTAAPVVVIDSTPVETTIAETVPPTTVAPTTLEPTTIPASVLATSVPTTIVVSPDTTPDQPVATVVPSGEPVEPIRFGRASTDLEPATGADIDRIAAFLSVNPNVEIGVAGYADSRGTKLQNMALAKVRAENVRQALIDRGIAAPRIKAVWFGDRAPVADNATDEGRAFNRRVEFRFFDAAIDAASAYGQDVSFTG